MSDDFAMDDAADEFEFEYEDDEEGGEEGADLENRYYTAKARKEGDVDQAIQDFESIVKDEDPAADWGFKALKQLTKTTFRRKEFARSLEYYARLLPYTKKAVTRNTAEKAINGILDYVSNSSDLDTTLMQRFYEETLKSLAEAKNDRLSQKTNLKLAKLWLDRHEYTRLTKLLRELHASISVSAADADADADNTRGAILLEIYALEIQMYGETKDNKKLREIYDKTLHVRSAVPHPRIMGIIRECGGKMHMSEKEWTKAQVDFFEAFRNYDEAGSTRRIAVLKYLVLSHMLMASRVNPFDSQETAVYKNDPEIIAMTDLVRAYQESNVHEAEKIIRDNRATITSDPFIQTHIAEVLRSLRTQWIVDIIKTYTQISLGYLAAQLAIPVEDVEGLVVALLLDGRVHGKIDQVKQILTLDSQASLDARRYASLDRWASELRRLQGALANKLPQNGGSQMIEAW